MLEPGLAGRIWNVRTGNYIQREVLVDQLSAVDYALLGELHDNAELHRLRLGLVEMLVARGGRPALALEQFDVDWQSALNDARQRDGVTADALADAGRFDRKGWHWPYYRPLVEIALRMDLPLIATNLSRADARRVAAEGWSALGAARTAGLPWDDVWNAARQQALERDIVEAHCGALPDALVPGLAVAQRARDAVMAGVLATLPRALLTAGNGHLRTDRGVPLYLRALKPQAVIASIAFVEVDGRDRPEDYAAGDGVAERIFDYLWFAPPAPRADPCAAFTAPK